ncbi:MAG TPA: hypothetical protein VGE02_15820 [Gemmatimonadales bacterium]
MNTRILLALAGATLLAACSSDRKEPTGPGGNAQTSYQATFKGGLTRTISGQAAFASDNGDTEIGFALVLADSEDESADDLIFFYRGAAGVPGTGTIDLADYASSEPGAEMPASAMIGSAILAAGSANPIFCAASGGSINVQSSASTRLKGTFTMTMLCGTLTGEEEFETQVTGSFDAAGGSVTIPG